MSVRILIGDCREKLRELPDQSVHCCVTSPPYFGLRDYGTAEWSGGNSDCPHIQPATGSTQNKGNAGKLGRPYRDMCGMCGATRIDRQMGLEPTPDEFVAGMVEVFREVRRVLRDDGVLFLNIGDSYFNTSVSGPQGKSGQRADRRFTAAGAGANAQRGAACGKRGKAPEGSPASDCFCRSLCGACRAAYRIGKSHNDPSLAPTPSASNSASSLGHMGSPSDHLPTLDSARQRDRNSDATRDPALDAGREGVLLPGAPASTTPQSSQQLLETYSAAQSQDGECRLCARSLADCARASVGMVECICGNASLASDDRNRGKDASASAHPSYTSESLKPKDLIGIPWLLAFALRADGWYLRQDIIWSKPNPMPESVRDRCTKAHEYLFLLSKSPRYYFDAEVIAEPLAYAPHAPGNTKLDASRNDHDQMQKVWGANGTRNKRSVWEVATQPFSEAHFATFPPALIEPCIKAGCPEGGTVLDPFGGAGTTGLVADRLQRDAVLIELNPEYADIARRRIEGDSPMFAQVAA